MKRVSACSYHCDATKLTPKSKTKTQALSLVVQTQTCQLCHRSVLREADHLRRNDKSEPPYTALRVGNLARAGCTQVGKGAQQEVLHIELTP